jgi:hypothetical protein
MLTAELIIVLKLIDALLAVTALVGMLLVFLLGFSTAWRLKRVHPPPPELKRISRHDRQLLSRFFAGEKVDIDPKLADALVRYSISSASMIRRKERIEFTFVVLALLLSVTLIILHPMTHRVLWLVVVVSPYLIFSHFQNVRRFNRFVAHWSEKRPLEGAEP